MPSYTFHDGFSSYRHLLDGVLPIRLESVDTDSDTIVKRFYNACKGWVRYKPLLLYLTDREGFEEKMVWIQETLEEILPQVCAYFHDDSFGQLLAEFGKYRRNVGKHCKKFKDTQESWGKLMKHMK